MELREFVGESLKQVIDGIVNAQEYAKQKGASINPNGLYSGDGTRYLVITTGEQYPIPQFIEFNIAVTVSEGTEAKAGIGVFTGAIGLGTQAKIEDGNVTISRIKFSVPVLFPEQSNR
jgi:hypothetical protein